MLLILGGGRTATDPANQKVCSRSHAGFEEIHRTLVTLASHASTFTQKEAYQAFL